MIPLELVPQLQEIPEEMIKQAAEQIGGDNNFKNLLVLGQRFRNANLTPVYLMTHDQKSFTVSSEETFGKRLH